MNVVKIEIELKDIESNERYYLYQNVYTNETIFLMDTLLFSYIEFPITKKMYDYENDSYSIGCYMDVATTKECERFIGRLKKLNGFDYQ